MNTYYSGSEYNDNYLIQAANMPKKPAESDKSVKQEVNDQIDMNIPGSELYLKVKKRFREYLESIAAVS
jgi:hypothetical protein